ncbi:MAG: hypothetical protein EOP51_00325 [Sphingobacteriales bacterium]|nr:MAG: hypothetical protein EOP51_00325 [Sphingobacteriales bacterium]
MVVKTLNNSKEQEATLIISDDRLEYRDAQLTEVVEGQHLPPFVLLKRLRRKLEEHNILLLVNGSRYDVTPSGMQLSMELPTAYIHTMGKPGQTEDIVNIFDEATINVGTIAEQENYSQEWFDSL